MANKIYVAQETSLTFKDSGGDVVITLNNLATQVARISVQKDRGAGSIAREHTIRGVFEWETQPVVGQGVDLYLSTSDGTDPDGQEGVSDADIGALGSLNNMTFIGRVLVTTATVDHQMTATFHILISTRYYSLVAYNNSDDNLQATANTSWIVSTPVPDEIQ